MKLLNVSIGTMALALGLVLPPAAIARAEGCSVSEQVTGGCVSGKIDGGAAVLTGSGGGSGSGDGGSDSSGTSAPPDPLAHCRLVVNNRCLFAVDHTIPTRPITLADIAAFRPDAGVDHMEPDGWMIVDIDTNFFATGGVQVKDGTLLGQPASVRFTPMAWHWSYSDGAELSTGGPGNTWAAQGIPEFDPTPTSHIFRMPGSYTIDLTIDYSAEYRFAGGQWVAIVGILPVPANRLTATAGDAKTVLVERDCTAKGAGPGC